MVRSVKYTQCIVDKFYEGLSQGKSLRSLCAAESMPSYKQVREWLKHKSDFQCMYRQALEDSAENFEDKILKEIEALTAENVRVAQIKINTWFKLMAQRNPKRYGDTKKSEFNLLRTVQDMTDEELKRYIHDA